MMSSTRVRGDSKALSMSSTPQDHPSILLAFPRVNPTGTSTIGSQGTDSPFSIVTTEMDKSATLITAEPLGFMVGDWAARDDNPARTVTTIVTTTAATAGGLDVGDCQAD